MQGAPQVDTQSEFYELLISLDHNSKCCCPKAFLNPLASLSSFQCVATCYIPVKGLSFIILHIHLNLPSPFVALQPLLLPQHLALIYHLCSFSLGAVVLAIIYDIYSTFHVAVYIPTLIKQFVPGNSMNSYIAECIEAKINGA
jgi:hypothetical protein